MVQIVAAMPRMWMFADRDNRLMRGDMPAAAWFGEEDSNPQ